MTLEEKIKNAATLKYQFAQVPNIKMRAFAAGSQFTLSELLPIMEEMKDVLVMIQESTLQEKFWGIVVDAESALEKYNALFEDKQKQP